ncbi:MAG: thermosome subunit alpha [archaeon]
MPEKPVVLMPEDIQRLIGRDAQRNNILAAKMVADIVKTTLGPKGMDKMLVSPLGEIVITNDGATILKKMQIEHPAAKMMVEVAKTQESEAGDGTTTVVMLAGKLLENAEKLLDMKIHPTVIAKGYSLAADKAQEILKEVAIRISPEDEEVLKQIAMTAMTGKGAEHTKEKLSEIIVKAIKQVQVGGNVDLDSIKIEKSKGEEVRDTHLISGIVLNTGRASTDMPCVVPNAKIALFDFALELKNPEIDTKISITSPEQLQGFLEREERTIKGIAEKIKLSGANVVFCQKGIDDYVKYLLSRQEIYACSRIPKKDLERVSKATGGKVVNNLNEFSSSDLGHAETVEEVRKADNIFTYVQGCKNPKVLTILVQGGTEHTVDEIERAIQDGIRDIASSMKSCLVIPGGGAVEIEVSRRLRQFAQTLSGREQLAIHEFASALEFIPSTLAENAGLDPIEILTELKSKHDSGEKNFGLNLFTNKVENVLDSRIIEPLKVKSQAIASSSEVAIMLLRIDDVIASSGSKRGMNYTGENQF